MPNKKEEVNHPAHYGGDTIYEAIKIIEAHDLDFHSGNAIKYILRSGKKDSKQELADLAKAIWYLTRRVAVVEGRGASMDDPGKAYYESLSE